MLVCWLPTCCQCKETTMEMINRTQLSPIFKDYKKYQHSNKKSLYPVEIILKRCNMPTRVMSEMGYLVWQST